MRSIERLEELLANTEQVAEQRRRELEMLKAATEDFEKMMHGIHFAQALQIKKWEDIEAQRGHDCWNREKRLREALVRVLEAGPAERRDAWDNARAALNETEGET